MSVETKPNKLVKGLVLDTFHTDVDNTVATYALNSQLEDQEGNHFHYGSEVGTTYIKEIPANHVVVGHINMERNETVLFTTDGTNSTIGILSRNDDMSYQYEIKVDDSRQEKKLNFKKEGYVRGVYRLLNGCDKVIYFVDGVNKDRRININQLDTYKLPTTASVASGIIFDDSLRATIFAISSATGNIQLIRLMSASPEATANVLANLTSGTELTKLLTASANGIGIALANLIRTANIVSSIEATGTSTVNVDIVRLLQSNVSAIGSVNAILQSSQQGLVEIDVILTGVASSTAILLRTALLEATISTQATTVVEAILTKVINAQAESSANTTSDAIVSKLVSSSVTATANTTADSLVSKLLASTVNGLATTASSLQLADVLTTSVSGAATVTNATLTSQNDSAAFFARVTAAGGSLNATEQTAITTLVNSLKSNGIWDKMLAIYPMVGGGQANPAAACAQNLKSSSFTASFTGMTFASTGVTGNGTTSYMETNFNLTQISLPRNFVFGGYQRIQQLREEILFGNSVVLADPRIELYARQSGGGYFLNIGGGFINDTNADARGFYLGKSNSAGTNAEAYKNGTLFKTGLSTPALKSATMWLGGINGYAAYSSNEFAFAFLGDGQLTATDVLNFYTAVQAFQTTLSRQV